MPTLSEVDVVRKGNMDVKIVTVTLDDEIRLKRIILDNDRNDVLKFAKELLGRITVSYNRKPKNHIDV